MLVAMAASAKSEAKFRVKVMNLASTRKKWISCHTLQIRHRKWAHCRHFRRFKTRLSCAAVVERAHQIASRGSTSPSVCVFIGLWDGEEEGFSPHSAHSVGSKVITTRPRISSAFHPHRKVVSALSRNALSEVNAFLPWFLMLLCFLHNHFSFIYFLKSYFFLLLRQIYRQER